MKRNLALLAGAAGGAIGAALVGRFRRPPPADRPDPRAEELRRKLSEAREAAAEGEELEASGMGGDTVATDQPPAQPTREEAASLRQRVHERGRQTAERMRPPSEP